MCMYEYVYIHIPTYINLFPHIYVHVYFLFNEMKVPQSST